MNLSIVLTINQENSGLDHTSTLRCCRPTWCRPTKDQSWQRALDLDTLQADENRRFQGLDHFPYKVDRSLPEGRYTKRVSAANRGEVFTPATMQRRTHACNDGGQLRPPDDRHRRCQLCRSLSALLSKFQGQTHRQRTGSWSQAGR